jgi:hypothetical protein
MNMDDLIKVSDAETLEWINNLDDNSKIELKRRALERRAVELLQPEPEAPKFGAMSDQELERYKMNNGFK